ncbi:MAG: helix-turn-helix domain-containing protein [Candidatus Cyclobacteriaceae bacterium M3_2C_046]
MIEEKIHQRKTPFPVVLPECGVYVFESYHSPEFEMCASAHDFHEIGIVLSGKGKIGISQPEFIEYEIHDGYICYLPPGLHHVFRDHPKFPLTLQMICVQDQVFRENSYLRQIFSAFRSKFEKSPVLRLGKGYGHQKIIRMFKEMIFEQTQKEHGFEVNLRYLVSSILIFLNRLDFEEDLEFNTREQAFMDSINFLNRHFYESPSIDRLARMAGQSYRGYTGYFKCKMGKTVVEYVTQLKINYVKKRLLESGSIEFSAYEAGFNDITNFYRVFKKYTGKTPKQFITYQ